MIQRYTFLEEGIVFRLLLLVLHEIVDMERGREMQETQGDHGKGSDRQAGERRRWQGVVSSQARPQPGWCRYYMGFVHT